MNVSRNITLRGLRSFSTTARVLVKAGDAIPDVQLYEGSPGNKVSIKEALGNKGLLIGVPAAFSMAELTECDVEHGLMDVCRSIMLCFSHSRLPLI